ncbi:hypothetical protein WCE39_13520 [Luteimonas sp. MJ174]|uniref:hypothetical protein n=1 Tax=Luteimonas sp. MJ174 TaxID=3129237 RepID=UPI0031BA028E
MPIKERQGFFIAASALFIVAGCTSDKYDRYEDCVLENVSGSTSEAAVVTVREACRAKFPTPVDSSAGQQGQHGAIDETAGGALEAAVAAQAAADSSSTISAQEHDDFDSINEVLELGKGDLVIAGGLRHCDEPGRAKAMFELASKQMLGHVRAQDGVPEVNRVGMRVILTADQFTEGARIGLGLSEAFTGKNAEICSDLVSTADDRMKQREP